MVQENSPLTEQSILSRLTSRTDLFAPLGLRMVEREIRIGDRRADALIEVTWAGKDVKFLVEVKSRTAPKLVSDAISQLKQYAAFAKKTRANLMLVVPFLTQSIIDMIQQEGISGLDLSGNYFIQTDTLAAIRLDRKNEFPESKSIKKVYSGSSSLVGRLFLSGRRSFASVNEVSAAIKKLGGSLSLSAVSKVLKSLEDDLVIERRAGEIALLQPDKLLQNLADGYRPPKVLETLSIKLPVPGISTIQNFSQSLPPSIRWVLGGESSVERYTVTTVGETARVYMTDFGPLAQYAEDRFFNAVLWKTIDSFPYFDAREQNGLRWASPVQCYLELSKMDKRERELAESVKKGILGGLK